MSKFVLLFIIVNTILQGFYCFNCVPRIQVEDQDKNDTKNDYTDVFPIILTRSGNELLKFFNRPEIKILNGVQELTDIYNRAKNKKDEYDKAGKSRKYPLIIMEGLSGSGKSTITAAIVKKINGTSFHSPSIDVEHLRNNFIHSSLLDNAYHHFANFITALQVYVLLNDSPVVIDRFWHSSETYYLARLVYNYPEKYTMPPRGDLVYTWPEELLKPDLVLFLEIDENIRLQRLHGRVQEVKIEKKFGKNEILLQNCINYRNNIMLAYKNMQNPAITIINDNLPLEEVLEQCYSKVKPFFKNE